MSRILIVGGLGYLGPMIASAIQNLLKPVVLDALDTNWFTHSALSDFKGNYNNIFYIDKRLVSEDFLGNYDIVIDLAAVSNDPMGVDFEEATFNINHQAAIQLASKCKMAGVKRFIFASSCSIYGAAGDKQRTENCEKNPLTAYAKSKWLAEKDLETLASADFSVVALRFATACGWSPTFRADLVLNDFVATALTENKITVLSDGTPWRPLIHVKDIGRAVAWASQAELTGFNSYNVGSNAWTLTIGDLAKTVASLLHVDYEIKGSGSDKRSYRVCFDKLEKDAQGWLPQEDVVSAVAEMRDELQLRASAIENFRMGNLIRLNVLKAKREKGEFDPLLYKSAV